jgi:two-component system response regulator FixJ
MKRFAYVIDDDEAVRASLRALLAARDDRIVVCFASGDAFLNDIDQREPGVVLLDLHMPGMSGMDVLTEMAAWPDRFATVMVTGQGDVPRAVQAMQMGAIDFLEKPYDHQALFNSVDRGFDLLDRAGANATRARAARELILGLSRRERQIVELMIDGKSNRGMAEALDLSVRTVEVHRANVMAKLNASSLSDVIHMAYAARLTPLDDGNAKG